MKIALIAPGAIPANAANSMQTMKMAQALAGLGHSLRVYALGKKPQTGWQELAGHYGLTTKFEIEWLPAVPWLRRYDFAWRAVHAAQRWSAELVYTRVPQAAALAAGRLPAIFELHDVPSGIMGPWLLRKFLRSKHARKLVVNTRYLAEQISGEYSITQQAGILTLAPNGVDLQAYDDLPDAATARIKMGFKEAFTAGYTGHLYKGRGISFIFELARRLPEMQFLLVGGRPEDVAVRKEQAGDLANVRIVGFVPNAELRRYQAACDVLLMPYGRQVAGSSGVDIAAYTNPLKMFEYLAAGRPILASDLPVLREVLNEENAVILPDHDLEAWVAALTALRDSAARRSALSAAARKTAAEFSWERRAQHVLSGIES